MYKKYKMLNQFANNSYYTLSIAWFPKAKRKNERKWEKKNHFLNKKNPISIFRLSKLKGYALSCLHATLDK